MRAILFLALLATTSCFAQTRSLPFNCGQFCNSSLTITMDDPAYYPLLNFSLLRKFDWTVNGTTIVVYPGSSGEYDFKDHWHVGAHVRQSQAHLRGPRLGSNGTIIGGAVYTVKGDFPGAIYSRVSERLDIENKTGSDLTLALTGFGFKPSDPSLPLPNLAGLELKGSTVIFYESASITESTPVPYGSAYILSMYTFTGFNPLTHGTFTIPAGTTLTMITELCLQAIGKTRCQ
ncbi:hypothetical protein BZM27_40480 [Paraburkholderia steynii]|uniref:Uncharacterized protein n=1 Tax=Paraburkholderia steynii TaxID=1245441 RepID=A0A4R0X338_9BURK|nr:hypothetical protein BZM27_40480 [Paraburkholderia steynii]